MSPSLSLVDIAAPPGPAQPAKPPQPVRKPPTPPEPIVVPPPVVPLPMPTAMAVAVLEASLAQAAGDACDLTAPVQEALRTDPAIQSVLATIPRPSRSVANALMIWDAGWLAFGDGQAAAARDMIRDAIAGLIAAAPEECRAQPQGGPRLLILPVGDHETIVLALGSGEWRWQDLLDTARPEGWVMAGAAVSGLQEKSVGKGIRPLTDIVAGTPRLGAQSLNSHSIREKL